MNIPPHSVHRCETRARSRSNNFDVQRIEQQASIIHSSSSVRNKHVIFIDVNLEL